MSEKMLTLAKRLLEKTRSKQIDWEEGFTDQYETHLPNFSVRIAHQGPGIYKLTVYNNAGKLVESIVGNAHFEKRDTYEKYLKREDLIEEDDKYDLLKEIYVLAEKSVINVEKSLEDLLEELG
ncbi:MAG: hypothetical protein KDG89_11260 [Geminicoccaceae bacterium]|nr:hypothetical protein [Geminicoccaceae bacterium]